MTIITAIEQARRPGRGLFAVQQALPRLHTVTVNYPTAQRIITELCSASVSFALEPEGLKAVIAVKLEDAALLDTAHTGA